MQDPNNGILTAVDSSGWPTTDFAICLGQALIDEDQVHGLHTVKFPGNADVTWNGAPSGSSITKNHDTSTNTTVVSCFLAQLVASDYNISLSFANTRRLPGDTTSTGLSYLEIMRPTTPGANTSLASGTKWRPQAVAMYAIYSIIRNLNVSFANGAGDTLDSRPWSRRVPPTSPV